MFKSIENNVPEDVAPVNIPKIGYSIVQPISLEQSLTQLYEAGRLAYYLKNPSKFEEDFSALG